MTRQHSFFFYNKLQPVPVLATFLFEARHSFRVNKGHTHLIFPFGPFVWPCRVVHPTLTGKGFYPEKKRSLTRKWKTVPGTIGLPK